MSNSKRWTDGKAAADEEVPVDGFFLDANAVRVRSGETSSEGSRSAGRRSQQDAAQELAEAFWGAPDAFPVEVKSTAQSPSVWSMDPKAGLAAGQGRMSASDIPPIKDAPPSYAPIPLRASETTADPSPLPQPFDAADLPGQEAEMRLDELASHSQRPKGEGSARPEAAPAAEPSAAPFDPFMGSPLGAPMGVPGGSDFFPGIPEGEFAGSSRTQAGASSEGRPASETSVPPVWAGPDFNDPGAEAGPGLQGGEFGAGAVPPFSEEHKEAGDPGAEILPWPGRAAASPIDAPIPVMGAAPENEFLGERQQTSPFDPGIISGDLLAEAVESALRNVYGDDFGEDMPAEQNSYLSERGLLREPAPGAQEPAPGMSALRDMYGEAPYSEGPAASGESGETHSGEGAEDWFGGRLEHQPAAFVAEPTTEAATEAVLHYLYGRREEGGQAESFDERSRSAGGRAPTTAFGRQPGHGETQRHEQHPSSFVDTSPRRVSAETSPYRSHAVDEAADFAAGQLWEQPQQRNMPVPTRPVARRQATAPEPMAPARIATDADHAASQGVGEKDSGRLLGAAGLGLIGGIALAGILAVFIFNSFVTDGGGLDNAGGAPASGAAQGRRASDVAMDPDALPLGSGSQPAQDTPQSRPALAKPDGRPGAQGLASASEANPAPAEERVAALPAVKPGAVRALPNSSGPILVSDASGPSSRPIPIALSIAAPAPAEAALVSIKGLPDQAKLSGGIDVGGGRWLLPPQKLEGLALSVPGGVTGDFKLEAQLMASDVRTAVSEPMPFTVTVTGSAAVESPVPAAAITPASLQTRAVEAVEEERPVHHQESPEMRELLQDGNKLMREGDILGARKYYDKVAATGSPEGALAMGRSFDPSYYESLPVKTGKPDPAQAFEWYKKALDGGLDTARVKIDNLKQWLLR